MPCTYGTVFGCPSGVYHLAMWKVTFAMYTRVTSAWGGVFCEPQFTLFPLPTVTVRH